MDRIVDIQTQALRERLAERDLGFELTPRARELLADAGFDPAYGARPLKRAIIRLIQNPLARALLGGDFSPGDQVIADAEESLIVFRHPEPQRPQA